MTRLRAILTRRLDSGSSSRGRWSGSAKPSVFGTNLTRRSLSSGASPAAASQNGTRLSRKAVLASAALIQPSKQMCIFDATKVDYVLV